jgi:hypothetical protein
MHSDLCLLHLCTRSPSTQLRCTHARRTRALLYTTLKHAALRHSQRPTCYPHPSPHFTQALPFLHLSCGALLLCAIADRNMSVSVSCCAPSRTVTCQDGRRSCCERRVSCREGNCRPFLLSVVYTPFLLVGGIDLCLCVQELNSSHFRTWNDASAALSGRCRAERVIAVCFL